jgi:SAM-dependent methyltransferase
MPNPTTLLSMRTSLFLQQKAHPYITGRLLDAGCGSKPYKRLFHELVTEWVGLDARPVAEHTGYIEENDFDDESFDSILCTNVIQYCPDPQIAVAELARVLKPGGCLIITAPNTAKDDATHRYTFTLAGLRELCTRQGLTIIESSVTTGLFADEFEAFLAWGKYALQVPREFRGFIEHLDRDYPLLSVAIARKEPPDDSQKPHV